MIHVFDMHNNDRALMHVFGMHGPCDKPLQLAPCPGPWTGQGQISSPTGDHNSPNLLVFFYMNCKSMDLLYLNQCMILFNRCAPHYYT